MMYKSLEIYKNSVNGRVITIEHMYFKNSIFSGKGQNLKILPFSALKCTDRKVIKDISC